MKIFKNVLWLIFDKLLILTLNLIVTVDVANFFGTYEYGVYQYAVSIIAVLEMIVTLTDARVVKKKYMSYNMSDVVLNTTLSRVFHSFIAMVIGIVILLMSKESNTFKFVFAILLLNMILANLRFGMTNRFDYILQSKKVVIAADISLCVSALLQLLIVRKGGTIIHIAEVALLSSFINILIIIIQYRRAFRDDNRGHINIRLLKEMVKESLPLALAASCAIIYAKCDSLMIGSLLTMNEVGVYSISLKMINVVEMANAPIRESCYPKLIELYSKNRDEYEKFYLKITSIMTWIFILGVLFSFIVLPYLMLFLRPEYGEAFSIYKIYVLGTFFTYNAALRSGHYTIIEKGRLLVYSQATSMIVNVILNFILIDKTGVYGAAIATAVTQFISLFVINAFCGKDGRQVLKWQVMALNPKYIFQKREV